MESFFDFDNHPGHYFVVATLLPLARGPVHVVSQCLGHTSPMVTLTVYANVMAGNLRDPASTPARLVRKARGT